MNPNEIIFEFNKLLIDNTYDLISVLKPQIALISSLFYNF